MSVPEIRDCLTTFGVLGGTRGTSCRTRHVSLPLPNASESSCPKPISTLPVHTDVSSNAGSCAGLHAVFQALTRGPMMEKCQTPRQTCPTCFNSAGSFNGTYGLFLDQAIAYCIPLRNTRPRRTAFPPSRRTQSRFLKRSR